ncbi:MAG: Hsp20/alpha crystallin family protein [Bacteroidota bacterium]|jgi:HSP20 family protein
MYLTKAQSNLPSRGRKRFITFNDLINDLFDDMVVPKNGKIEEPRVNIYNESDRYRLDVIAPGFEKNQFKITVEEDVITIQGEIMTDACCQDDCCTRKEHQFKSFSRSFTLPENTNKDAIAAQYVNGVLSVSVPKLETVKSQPSKSIEIQ